MKNIVVVGTQWGDEGKGKIVDFLSEEADVIVRFQGGHNAGHTLVIDGTTYKLSILPSGIIREDKISIIGNGVVLNPWSLLDEIEKIKKFGITITNRNLKISKSAPLILPIHSLIDNSREIQRGNSKIGTTGRGIGPAYEDKVARRAIRVSDLEDSKLLKDKIHKIVDHHNIWLKAMNVEIADAEKIFLDLLDISNLILNYAEDTWFTLQELKDQGKKILFEGAQGAMLDIDHGTYPFVTSSSTVAGQAASGSGFGSTNLNSILGITKAYTTRVGSGPFPTEQINEIGNNLGKLGNEFGTVTGRKRRCGWFDAVMVKQALKISGVTTVALTKLDVLDTFQNLKICTSYKIENNIFNYLPSDNKSQNLVEPIYEEIQGWEVSTKNIDKFEKLPENAISYIKRLEELIECPIKIISTSPDRKDTIILEKLFN
ncbi:MAG: adenylosuccinate synthase [Candidatus Puniceispirillales bacterium]